MIRELKFCPFCGRPVTRYNMECIGPYVRQLDIDCQCGAHVSIEAAYYYVDAVVTFVNGDGDAVDIWNRSATEDLSKEK